MEAVQDPDQDQVITSTAVTTITENVVVVDDDDDDDDDLASMFDLTKKKKKKKMKHKPEVTTEELNVNAWVEYDYDTMLGFIYDRLRREGRLCKNADGGGISNRFVIPAPIMGRLGGKKTLWMNFTPTCEKIHRPYDRVMSFITKELMISNASIAGYQRYLVMPGRWTSSQVESVLRKYCVYYILCKQCKGHNTIIHRNSETRYEMLICDDCQSERPLSQWSLENT